MKRTILESLNTVQFGELGTYQDFCRAVMQTHGKPLTTIPEHASATCDYVWLGEIRGATGTYWIPYAWDGAKIAAKPSINFETGKDLTGDLLATPCCVWCEIDDVPLQQQAHLLDELISQGLPEPTAVCTSGGKSLHCYWAVRGLTEPMRATFALQLLALVDGDWRVKNANRKMRPGGFACKDRVQTIYHLDKLAVTTPEDFGCALDRICGAQGIDPRAWYDARLSADRQKTAANRSTNPNPAGGHTHKAGLAAHGVLPADTVFRTRNGSGLASALVGDGNRIKVFCPVATHQTESKSPAAVLFGGSPARCYCFACCKTWTVTGEGALTVPEPVDPELDLEDVFAAVGAVPTGDHYHRINQRYLGDISQYIRPSDKYVVLRSPMGTGKTTAIAQYISAQKTPAIVVSPRIPLTQMWRDTLQTLGVSTVWYKDVTGPISAGSQSVSVCLDSLHRVLRTIDMDATPDGTLVLDEAKLQLLHFAEKGMHSRERNVKALFSHIRDAKLVVLAQAEIDQNTLDVVREIGGAGDACVVVNEYQPAHPRGVVCWEHVDKLKAFSLDVIAKRTAGDLPDVVQFTKLSTLRTYARALHRRNPTLRILQVYSNRPDDTQWGRDAQAFLSSPDTEIARWDVVLASPSLGTGFSISAPVGRVWGFLEGGSITSVDASSQMIGRYRNPQHLVVHLFVSKSCGEAFTTPQEVEELERSLKHTNALILAKYASEVAGFTPDVVGEKTFNFCCRMVAARRCNQANYRNGVLLRLAEEGYSILDQESDMNEDGTHTPTDEESISKDQVKDIRKDRKKDTAEIEAELVDAVLASPDPAPGTDPHTLLRGATTEAVRHSAIKGCVTDDLGELTDEAVHHWAHRKGAAKARLCGRIESTEADVAERVKEGSNLPGVSLDLIRRRFYLRILGQCFHTHTPGSIIIKQGCVYGVDPLGVERALAPYTTPQGRKVWAALAGFKLPKEVLPIRILGSLLETLGLKLTSKETTKENTEGGKKIRCREYTLDLGTEHNTRALRWAAHQALKIKAEAEAIRNGQPKANVVSMPKTAPTTATAAQIPTWGTVAEEARLLAALDG